MLHLVSGSMTFLRSLGFCSSAMISPKWRYHARDHDSPLFWKASYVRRDGACRRTSSRQLKLR
jgi:hypothetical protein